MGRLNHSSIERIVMNLAESNVINLDSSVRSLLEPVAKVMRDDPGSEVGLHILCCNEYALVTGLTDTEALTDIVRQSAAIKGDLR